jgi:aminoacylase
MTHHAQAVRRLKATGFQPVRNVYLLFVPDEETGGEAGMMGFLETPEFRALRVGFVLDEGLANPRRAYSVYYSERSPFWIRLVATGNAGHGSRFIEPNATIRLVRAINKFLAFREAEKQRLAITRRPDGSPLTLGDVTTTNLTNLRAGGTALNVVPDRAEACFDLRVPVTVDLVEFKAMIRGWCEEEGVALEFTTDDPVHAVTRVDADPCHAWWLLLSRVCETRGIPIELEVFPASTDSRYLRRLGIPALGFSPIHDTPILL